MSNPETIPDSLAEMMKGRCREDWETAVELLAENDMPFTSEIPARMMQLVFGDADDKQS